MAVFNTGVITQRIPNTIITLEHRYSIEYRAEYQDFKITTNLYAVTSEAATGGTTGLRFLDPTLQVYLDTKNHIGLASNIIIGLYDLKSTTFWSRKDLLPNRSYFIASYEGYFGYTIDQIQVWHSLEDPIPLGYNNVSVEYKYIGSESYGGSSVQNGPSDFIIGVPDELVSTITATDTYFESMTTIAVNRKNKNFTHSIEYSIGDYTAPIVERDKTSNYNFYIENGLIEELPPGDNQGTMTFTCYTYDPHGYLVGEPQTADIKVIIPNNSGRITLNVSVEDTNPTTLALTGDSSILVRGYSNAYVVCQAIPLTGNTITSQTITAGNKIINGSTATFNAVNIDTFSFMAVDSRNFTAVKDYTAPMINYTPLSTNIYVSIPTVSGKITVKVEGNYFNQSFGKLNNTLSVLYRYKVLGEDWPAEGGWRQIGPTVSGDNYYSEFDITGFNYRSTYVFQAIAYDKLTTIVSPEVLTIGKPVFDWGKEDFHIGVQLNVDEDINMDVDQSITGTTADGTVITALTPLNSSGDTVLGYGNYSNESGDTYIYGDNVNLIANNAITVNGRTLGGKILWTGPSQMLSYHTITLKENISSQISGIVLVFSAASGDVSVNSFFISKKDVEAMDGAPHSFFLLNNSGLATVGAKYLYISDGSITGHDTNSSTGTAASGITFTNNNFVLRYIIGV